MQQVQNYELKLREHLKEAVSIKTKNLSQEERWIFDARYRKICKRMDVAFVLGFFFGMLGVGRFYMGHYIYGTILLAVTLSGFLLSVAIILWFIDLFLIMKHTHKNNLSKIDPLIKEIMAHRTKVA